jgi:DNA-binding SARP family transcriptional activator/tetratricopeptide (TPR) repeat protein
VEDEVWLRLLGPVEIRNGRGGWLRPRGPQLRATLASLGLSAGRVVPLDDLVDALWEDQSPRSARASVQILVARLRKALREVPDCKVDRYGDGYLLHVGLDGVDVHRFRSLVKAARQATSHQEAISKLGRALTLWRGPALADVSATPRVEAIRAGLAEEQLSAAEDRFGHLLAAGRHTEAAEEIPLMLAAHPLAERLAGLLMLAWYRCGRQADALGVYRNMRGRLAHGLGVEPGPDLQRLHQLILAGDPALIAPDGVADAVRSDEPAAGQGAPRVVVSGRPPVSAAAQLNGHYRPVHLHAVDAVVPHELPSPPARLTGRVQELSALTGWLDEGTGTGGPVVLAVCGPPGVGKTALALQWARQVQDRFPDGQLHVDLGGYGPSPTPASPDDAIATVLQSLGIPADQIARRADYGTGLYRSLLADRRMLVLLDNARDEAQVRPLLPGSPTCVVLVTSRSDLGGLVASHGARPLTLDVLSPDESWQLLASRVGADRAAAEDGAVTELVSLCAGLPLALAIVASRAATRPAFQLATLAAELRGTCCRLDGLDTGDQAASIRAVFSWSYRMLSETAARLFRLLGAHPGPDISAAAAASLSGTSAASARAALSELVRAHLIDEQVPERFAMHDLLRSYAADQGDDGEHRTAIRQVLDYYLTAAYAAMRLAYPDARQDVLPPNLTGQHEKPTGPHGARAWLETEHHVLLAVIGAAASNGFDEHGWQLPAIMREHLVRGGHYADDAQAQRTALACAIRLADRPGQAVSHRNLGDALIQLSSRQGASEHLGRALAIYRELADQAGQATCHCALARLLRAQGDFGKALRHTQHSLRLYRAAGDLAGEAAALNGVGWDYALLGDSQRAFSYCTRALEMHRRSGDRLGQALTLDSLGYCCQQAGRHSQAAAFYQQALDAFADAGDRYYRAQTFVHLGDALRADGNPDTALEAWRQALDILDDMDHPDARTVRDKLRAANAMAFHG